MTRKHEISLETCGLPTSIAGGGWRHEMPRIHVQNEAVDTNRHEMTRNGGRSKFMQLVTA